MRISPTPTHSTDAIDIDHFISRPPKPLTDCLQFPFSSILQNNFSQFLGKKRQTLIIVSRYQEHFSSRMLIQIGLRKLDFILFDTSRRYHTSISFDRQRIRFNDRYPSHNDSQLIVNQLRTISGQLLSADLDAFAVIEDKMGALKLHDRNYIQSFFNDSSATDLISRFNKLKALPPTIIKQLSSTCLSFAALFPFNELSQLSYSDKIEVMINQIKRITLSLIPSSSSICIKHQVMAQSAHYSYSLLLSTHSLTFNFKNKNQIHHLLLDFDTQLYTINQSAITLSALEWLINMIETVISDLKLGCATIYSTD